MEVSEKYKDMSIQEMWIYRADGHVPYGKASREWLKAIRKKEKDAGWPFRKRDTLYWSEMFPCLSVIVLAALTTALYRLLVYWLSQKP